MMVRILAVLVFVFYGQAAVALEAAPDQGAATADSKDTFKFKFGKSEADLVKSVPGLVCGEAELDLWGGADRACVILAQIIPNVGGTIVFNLRDDKFFSTALVIDQGDVGALLAELLKRHGKPSAAVPSINEPQKVVWLYENRVLILDRSLAGVPDMSSLLVSADESILEQARMLVTHLRSSLPPDGTLSAQ
jgi:hypothetical protein